MLGKHGLDSGAGRLSLRTAVTAIRAETRFG